MRLSAFSVLDAYSETAAAGGRLPETVRLASRCEGAGLSALWVAEHHFHRGGVCPSPPVLLAACGAATRRLRLGAMVSVLPFHRPIDLAEEYATLDQVLEGRLNLGLGSGYIPLEFEGFGVDPGAKRATFDSALEFLRAAWDGREVKVGGPSAPAVRLNVLPVQRPHPPLWVAVQRREAVAHVARRGLSVALIPYATLGSRSELAEEIREFRALAPPGRRTEVAVAVHLYAGERPDDAREALRRYLESRLETQSTFFREKAARDAASATVEGVERSGFAIFGSPEHAARELEAFAALGVDELLGIFDFGGLPEAEVARSVEAVGRRWATRSSGPA